MPEHPTPLPIRTTIVASLALICVSSAPFVQFTIHVVGGTLDGGSWAYIYTYWFAALVGLAYFARQVQVTDRFQLLSLIIVSAFGTWLLASVTWAGDFGLPAFAVLTSALLLAAAGFGLMDFAGQTWSLFVSTQSLAVLSIIEELRRPGDGLAGGGNWQGIFANRNTLGPVAAIGCIAALGIWLQRPGRRTAAVAMAAAVIDVFLVWQAASATAIVSLATAVVALGLALLVAVFQRRGTRGSTVVICCGIGLGVATAFVVVAASIGLDLVGRSSTFTGRRGLWEYLIDSTADARWLGLGYGSYWADPERIAPYIIESQSGWDSAHSTAVEVLIGTGVIGVVLLAALVGRALTVTSKAVWQTRTPATYWWVAILTFAITENLTESMITYQSMFWLLIVAACFRPTAGRGIKLISAEPSIDALAADDTVDHLPRAVSTNSR